MPYCTLGNAYFDVALLASETQNARGRKEFKILLGLLEIKKRIGEENYQRHVAQTVCYMISALAYSRLGALRNKTPLVALLVASNAVFRITLKRPLIDKFGWMIKIERTTDVKIMEWVLADYISSFVRDYKAIESYRLVRADKVNALDWIPLNLPRSKWSRAANGYNFGFLFKTSSDEVLRVSHKRASVRLSVTPSRQLIVKHVSELLDKDFEAGVNSIRLLLDAELLYKKDKLLEALISGRITVEQAAQQLKGPATQADEALVDEARPANATGPDVVFGVKHPYVGLLGSGNGVLLVMDDVGTPLSRDLLLAEFRQQWSQSRNLRVSFFEDVCLSALNLVEMAGLCHNDIRPPNIAVRGDRFCLVDFDLARRGVVEQPGSAFSPELQGFSLLDSMLPALMMCYSTAQIIVTAYMLRTTKPRRLSEVTEATSIWTREREASSAVDAEFQLWARARGPPLLSFVAAVRGEEEWPAEVTTDPKGYCCEVLQCALELLAPAPLQKCARGQETGVGDEERRAGGPGRPMCEIALRGQIPRARERPSVLGAGVGLSRVEPASLGPDDRNDHADGMRGKKLELALWLPSMRPREVT